MKLKKYKNFGFSHWRKPTPSFYKKLGVFLATFGGALLVAPTLTPLPSWIGVSAGIIAAIGAGITKMFSDESV